VTTSDPVDRLLAMRRVVQPQERVLLLNQESLCPTGARNRRGRAPAPSAGRSDPREGQALRTEAGWEFLETVVERRAWIGSGAVVLAGARVGEGALVRAGASWRGTCRRV
jgi:hypothetical protein